MKFTSFKQIPLSIFIVVLTTVSSYSSERVSGSQIKDQIIAQASKAGIIVVPQTPDQKVYYPCADSLNIVPKGKNWKTVEVQCESPFQWKINIRNIVKNSTEEKLERNLDPTSEKNNTTVKYIPKLKVPTELKKIDRPAPYETSVHRPLTSGKEEKTAKINKKNHVIIRDIPIRREPDKLFEYFILDEPLNKGAIISSIDQLKTKLFRREVRGGYLDSSQIIGRKLKVSIPAGKPILSRFLTTNYTVEKDTILDLTLQRASVKVTIQGRALSDGQLGEIILVSNLSSGVKLRAKIKNAHEAEIITKQLN